MTRRVLITGAAGMLGRRLVEAFESGWSVVPATRRDMDVTDLDASRRFVKEAAPHVVIHAAAYTDVDGCEKDPDRARRTNGIGTRNVAIATRDSGADLLYVSSDFVFDGTQSGAYHEWDAPRPISVYGESKLWGEHFVRDLLTRFWIVRTQWVFGPDGKNFVDTIRTRAGTTGELHVVNDQRGSPTYTVDLASEIRRIVDSGGHGVYHVSNGGECTWHEFAVEIVKQAGLKNVRVLEIGSAELARPARRPTNSVLANTHLELTIGRHMRPWRDALAHYLQQKTESK
ncbi:MAG: dTDP-4-dehydrorhamnose reductase [Planctomycetes bacterium]|nr:dTDP-4-dehydrorhamnose reductase [Planctomycetota bacterium]